MIAAVPVKRSVPLMLYVTPLELPTHVAGCEPSALAAFFISRKSELRSRATSPDGVFVTCANCQVFSSVGRGIGHLLGHGPITLMWAMSQDAFALKAIGSVTWVVGLGALPR